MRVFLESFPKIRFHLTWIVVAYGSAGKLAGWLYRSSYAPSYISGLRLNQHEALRMVVVRTLRNF